MTDRSLPGPSSPGWDSSPSFRVETSAASAADSDLPPNPSAPTESSGPAPDADASGFGAGVDDAGGSAATVQRKRKRRSRRTKATGGKAKAAEKAKAGASAESSSGAGSALGSDSGGRATKKKRRKRKRKTSTKAGTDSDSDQAQSAQSATSEGSAESGSKPAKKRRRRGSRGGRKRKSSQAAAGVEAIPGEEDDLPELPELPPETEELGKGRKKVKKARKTTRKKKAAKAGKASTTRAKKKVAQEPPDQLILVNAIDHEEKRVIVVEDDKIVDVLMTVESQKTLVGDIYRGKVVNLEPAIGAAFVDFGQGRNGFLHTSDVLSVYGEPGFTLDRLLTAKVDPGDLAEAASQAEVSDVDHVEEEAPAKSGGLSGRRRSRKRVPISDLLSVGDYVVVQVTKDAIGDKGPTLTTYISIPGRSLVLMPSMSRTGVSRKIEDEKERRRLKRILQTLDAPAGMGVIVRTAGVGKNKTEIKRDLEYLLGVWENFGKRLKSGRGPMPLYQESDIAIKTLRDLFHSGTEALIVDDPIAHEKLVDFANQLMPEQVDRIKMHEAERPIFHHHGMEPDFEKVFTRRVELPSGGSIVFDQTEALVAIDVNSGRTRSNGFDFEDIALKTNLDAVPEIARQIRLRDLGGIIVCDFIDMQRGANIRTVERAFRAELAKDRARSKVGRISQFGLLEMTRQRLGPGMDKKVFQSCPRCRGTGRIRSVQSRAAAILRRLGSALTQKGFSTVEVRAHPEVVDYLNDQVHDYVRALEHRFEKEIMTTPVPDQVEDSVLRYLRADGREVRPGGRRKR